MAQPEAGLEKWELRKLKELNVASWKNADDAKAKMKEVMQARAKANEAAAKTTGFAALDEKAAVTTAPTTAKDITATYTKTETPLPHMQKVDVSAPTINVHVPAPGVTVLGDTFAWYPATMAVVSWLQAAVIGAATYAALSSRFVDVLTLTVR